MAQGGGIGSLIVDLSLRLAGFTQEQAKVSGILRDMGAKFWDGTEWKLEVADERGDTLFVLRFSAEERLVVTDQPPDPGAP